MRRCADLHSSVDAAVEALRGKEAIEELPAALVRRSAEVGSRPDDVGDVDDDEAEPGLAAQAGSDAKRLFGLC